MTARRTSRATSRIGAVLATAALAVTGMALTAAPASAADSGSDCPPATSPPSPNTWLDSGGNLRGVRTISRRNIPETGMAVWQVRQYETFGGDHYQRESWEFSRHRDPIRLDCKRKETPEPPEPKAKGGGGSATPIGGGGTLWMISVGGGDDEPVRYGKVGEVEPL